MHSRCHQDRTSTCSSTSITISTQPLESGALLNTFDAIKISSPEALKIHTFLAFLCISHLSPGAIPLQGFRELRDVRCRGIPYTYDPCYNNCNGFAVSTIDECWQKCIANDFPSGCDSSMNSSCMAVSLKSGVCQLFNDQCWQMDTDQYTTTRVKKFDSNMRFFEGTRCKNNPYTYLRGGCWSVLLFFVASVSILFFIGFTCALSS